MSKKVLMMLCAAVLSGIGAVSLYAQGLNKTPVCKGVYKVKSGNFYGICDENDNIKVSVEYNDIIFVGDVAILTKDMRVYGYVRKNGHAVYFDGEYRYNPKFPFYSEGYLPVMKVGRSSKEQWMYLDMNGKPIVLSGTRSLPMIVSQASAFSEGYAVVQGKKGKLSHIDKYGNERFVLNDETVYFRSAVRDGECVMITSSGVKVYQESPSKEAIVKMILSSTCNSLRAEGWPQVLTFAEGSIYLDHLGRADRFVSSEGNVTSLVKQKPVLSRRDSIGGTGGEREPEEKFAMNSLQISISRLTATASVKGYASTTIYVDNGSDLSSGELTLTIKSSGMSTKEETFNLSPGARQKTTIYIPARFSEESRRQTVTVIVSDGKEELEKSFTMTLKRYQPEILL